MPIPGGCAAGGIPKEQQTSALVQVTSHSLTLCSEFNECLRVCNLMRCDTNIAQIKHSAKGHFIEIQFAECRRIKTACFEARDFQEL